MLAGAFDDPAGDGKALGQGVVVPEIGRVVEEIVGAVIDGLPIGGGHRAARGAPAHPGGDHARLAPEDRQQVFRPALFTSIPIFMSRGGVSA
jgi:hypothetical protein